MYSILKRDNLLQDFQMHLSQKRKVFCGFFLHFISLASILNIFKKRMTFIADVFLNLQTAEYVVKRMSKKSRFGGPFEKWHGKRAETLLKSDRQYLYNIYWSLWRQFSWQKSLLLISKILGLLLTYLLPMKSILFLSRSNLLQHFQMHLFQK